VAEAPLTGIAPAGFAGWPVALDHAGREAGLFHRLGHLHDLDRARPMRQPPDEAALLQRRDQPVDPGLGAQVQRLLHLVEGRRHAIALHTLVDEFQKIALFAGQHRIAPPAARPHGSGRGALTSFALRSTPVPGVLSTNQAGHVAIGPMGT
jgi:hypothetical protein